MKGYVPEGSYMLLREMFEAEEIGTIFNNWAAPVLCSFVVHPGSLILPGPTNFFNKYKALRLDHSGSAIHVTRLPDPNEFVQDFSLLIYVPSTNANASKFRLRWRDSAGNVILGMGTTKTGGNVYIYLNEGTSGGWQRGNDVITEDNFHELRVLIHNDNSNTPNRLEFIFDGHKVWYDAALNRYTRDKTKSETVKKINSKISYMDISTFNTTAGDYCFYSAFVLKEWADTTVGVSIPEDLPFLESIIQANDKATFYKQRTGQETLAITDSLNESPVCNFTVAPHDVNNFVANFITDSDDGNWQHFTFDNRFRVFLQQAKYIMHGWKAESLLGTPDILTDSLVDFDALGVLAGDKIWIFKQGEAIDNPFTVISVPSATTLEVAPDISDGISDVVHISYQICRGMGVTKASAFGDYIFKGQIKDYRYSYDSNPNVNVTALSDAYIAIQKHIWCQSTRYYRKNLDEVLTGRFRYDSLLSTTQADQIVNGLMIDPDSDEIVEGLDIGNYSGILGTYYEDWDSVGGIIGPNGQLRYYTQAFQGNISDVGDDNMIAPITKQWGPEQTLFDAINSLADTIYLQFDVFTDDEFRDERVIFFRDRKLIEQTQLLNFWVGELYPADFNLTETDRPMKSVSFNKGTREFIDRVTMLGASNPNTGSLMADDQPPNYPITGQTRDVIKTDTNILDLNLVRQNAIAMLADLARKPEEGEIVTVPISILETWFDDIYASDADIETYYMRQQMINNGYHFGDSDWFTNLQGTGENEKDRTSQGHCHRRPFSLVGEPCRVYRTATDFVQFIINSWSFASDSGGMIVSIEPDVNQFENSRYLSQIKREIEWTNHSLSLAGAAVQECISEPFGKLFTDIGENLAVGKAPLVIVPASFNNPLAALIDFQFIPFNYQDKTDSQSAYGYAFFASDTGLWGSWDRIRVQGQAIFQNLVTDIDDSVPDILMNNDPGGFYGNAVGSNFIFLDLTALPWYTGAGQNVWIMVVLANRHIIDTVPAITHAIPRQTTPGTPISTADVVQTRTVLLPFYDGDDEENQIIQLIDGPFPGVI